VEERLEAVADDGVRLVGTLARPAADAPAPGALLLNGSGPLDRDSGMRGQRLAVAPALAAALAAHGVASLRIDKRGVGESGGDYLAAGFEREAADAASALAALRAAPGIDPARCVVVGHSVGATIAMRLASGDPGLAGIGLLAGAARPGREVMRWQSERIARSLRGPARLAAGWVERRQERMRRRLLASRGDVISVGGRRLPARWMREFMAYDPVADLPGVRCRVLAITGAKDIQVDPEDVARIGRLVAGPFEGDVPEDLTHLLRRDPGPPGLSRYRAQLRRPPDPALMERVAAWAAA
jgi:pimeloyl-ACP methyl ester carboxylesterase